MLPLEPWPPPPPPPPLCSQLSMNILLSQHPPLRDTALVQVHWYRSTMDQSTSEDFQKLCKRYTIKPHNPCVDGLSIIHHSFLAVEREGESP